MTVAALVGLALAFAFLNGYNGSGSLVATLISTGAAGARRALLLAAVASFVGLFAFGLAVAYVVGTDIVELNGIDLASVAAALVSALLWFLVESALGIPSSSTQALMGGLIGGAIAATGLAAVKISGLVILAVALVAAPIVAVFVSWLAMRLTIWLVQGAPPRINNFFRAGQLPTSILLAASYGTSNGQKIVGIIALILYQARLYASFTIPAWVVAASACALSLGIATGGWQVIRTLGARIYRPRPINGFVAQSTAAVIVLGATVLGGPVSLSQIASTSIIGAGMAERMSKVRWEVAEQMVVGWLITLPLTAVVAIVLYPVARYVVG
ncbi:MAG: inorganic phosphate transporter [Chloroflexota bacterium]